MQKLQNAMIAAVAFVVLAHGAQAQADARLSKSNVRAAVAATPASFFEHGDLPAAERAYAALADAQNRAGENPVDALRQLANVQFARNEYRAEVATLDEMAMAAGRFGDPETRVRSLLEATMLYKRLGDRVAAESHVAQITVLLRSAGISPDTRRIIKARIQD